MKKEIKIGILGVILMLGSFSQLYAEEKDEPVIRDPEIYNVKDLAEYGKFLNESAIKNGMTTFLWDCGEDIDRKTLTVRTKQYVDTIVGCYPKAKKPGNGKNNEVFEEETAFDACKKFGPGWNLGNTLDSTSFNIVDVGKGETGWILKWGAKDDDGKVSVKAFETAWGQPQTTQDIADFVISQGFNAIRIPVTWAEHLDKNDIVDKKWMARVHETVDYFYNCGVYCILNVHHDGGGDGWIEATKKSYETYNVRFEKLWTQIATEFMNYDERLLFESMNEVLDGNNSWSEPTKDASDWINKWNQLFVTTVRKTGGNNGKRNLVVMTYGGGMGEGNFNKFVLPKDSAKNHLIIEIHTYDPQGFCWKNVTYTRMTAVWYPKLYEPVITEIVNRCKKYSDKFGVPVIIGEYNADAKKYADYK